MDFIHLEHEIRYALNLKGDDYIKSYSRDIEYWEDRGTKTGMDMVVRLRKSVARRKLAIHEEAKAHFLSTLK